MPHCTMEKDKQIKGKGNGDIHPKYVHYIVKFLEHVGMSVSDSEMKHLGYVNVSEAISCNPEIIFPGLYNNKYFYKNNFCKIKNKNHFVLWDIFGLVSFDVNMNVKIDDGRAIWDLFIKPQYVTNSLRESICESIKGGIDGS